MEGGGVISGGGLITGGAYKRKFTVYANKNKLWNLLQQTTKQLQLQCSLCVSRPACKIVVPLPSEHCEKEGFQTRSKTTVTGRRREDGKERAATESKDFAEGIFTPKQETMKDFD